MADTEAAAPTTVEEVTETPVEEVAAEEEVAADEESPETEEDAVTE